MVDIAVSLDRYQTALLGQLDPMLTFDMADGAMSIA